MQFGLESDFLLMSHKEWTGRCGHTSHLHIAYYVFISLVWRFVIVYMALTYF